MGSSSTSKTIDAVLAAHGTPGAGPPATAAGGAWWQTVVAIAAMTLAVLAVYRPLDVLTGRAVFSGADHEQLHARRMRFARESLNGPERKIPAWYPRELMGNPFRANLQNFPLIPTRLVAFALFETDVAFMFSVIASSVLAALFTYLFCRRLGLSRTGSAAAGWTFACCGFYVSRVLAGHLPLLEAFPALPALLWLTDRAARKGEPPPRSEADLQPGQSAVGRTRWRTDTTLLALAIGCACFAVAGHPQLPVYALAVSGAWALVRAVSWRRAAAVAMSMILGLGLAGFALYPMALLTQRSTRVLALDRAHNDLAMPYTRLLSMFFPWRDGWPPAVTRGELMQPFTGFPTHAYFWDTVNYIGWAPLICIPVLLAAAVILLVCRRRPGHAAWFFPLCGVIAFAMSLPFWQQALALLPGTFLRSPARLLYVVSFTLALALGAFVTLLIQPARRSSAASARGGERVRAHGPAFRAIGWTIVAITLSAHAWDLSAHARAFILTRPYAREAADPARLAAMRRDIGGERVAMDAGAATIYNRAFDDIGFFDSLILARPYRFILDTAGLPATLNEQQMDGSGMPPRTLRLTSTRLVITPRNRRDLARIRNNDPRVGMYLVSDTTPRASAFPAARVRYCPDGLVSESLRDPQFRADEILLLPETARATLPAVTGEANRNASTRPGAEIAPPPGPFSFDARYDRPDPDRIESRVIANQPCWLQIVESFDPGWSATVDGKPTEIFPAHGALLAVAVPSGTHEVSFRYRTPGAGVGLAISAVSALALIGLALVSGTSARIGEMPDRLPAGAGAQSS